MKDYFFKDLFQECVVMILALTVIWWFHTSFHRLSGTAAAVTDSGCRSRCPLEQIHPSLSCCFCAQIPAKAWRALGRAGRSSARHLSVCEGPVCHLGLLSCLWLAPELLAVCWASAFHFRVNQTGAALSPLCSSQSFQQRWGHEISSRSRPCCVLSFSLPSELSFCVVLSSPLPVRCEGWFCCNTLGALGAGAVSARPAWDTGTAGCKGFLISLKS